MPQLYLIAFFHVLFNVLLRKLNMYEVLGRGANIAIKRFAFFFSSSIFGRAHTKCKITLEEKKYALEIIQTFRS